MAGVRGTVEVEADVVLRGEEAGRETAAFSENFNTGRPRQSTTASGEERPNFQTEIRGGGHP